MFRFCRAALVMSFAAGLLFATGSVFGQSTYTWNGPTSGSANWTTATDWTANASYPGSTSGTYDTATFSAILNPTAPVTLTAPANLYLNAINFNQNNTSYGYTIAGGVINLGGTTPTITVTTSGVTETISSILAGSNGLTVAGAGGLTLNSSSVETFTGGLTISGGATLQLNFSNLTPVSGAVSNLINSGNALSLAGTLSITGNPSGTTAQTFAGVTLAGGSTIRLTQNGGTSTTLGLGAITRTTGTMLNFSIAPSTSGTIVTTTNGNDATGMLGTWANIGSGTIFSYATVNGSGEIVPYTGFTAAASAATLGSSATTNYQLALAAGATPATVSANTIQFTGAAGTTAPGATSFTVNGLMNSGAGLWTIGTNTVTIGANQQLAIAGNTQGITISSVIQNNGSGASSLMYGGAGTLTLANTNTYSGGTYINSGTLAISSLGALGSGAVNLDGGTLTVNYTSSTVTIANAITIAQGESGNLNVAGSGAFYLNTGTITVNGTLLLTRNGGGIGGGGFFSTFAGSGTLVLGSIQAGTSITTYNPGEAFFYSVPQSVHILANSSFTYEAQNAAGSANTVTIDSGGYFTVAYFGSTSSTNSNTTYIGGLNGAGAVTTTNNSTPVILNLGNGNQNGNFSGVISSTLLGGSGTLGIHKEGTGTQVLSGFNTFTGAIYVDNGTLQLGTKSGSLVGSIPTATTVYLGNSASSTTGVFQLGDADNPVNQTLSYVILQYAGSGSVVGGNSANSILNINAAGTLAAQLGGSGVNNNNLGLTFSGTGALLLSNSNNTYTGPTAIAGGTLQLGASQTNGTALAIGSGTTSGVLDLGGFNATVSGLATSGTGTSNFIGNSSTSSNSTLIFVSGTSNFGGIIKDTLGSGSYKVNLQVNSGYLTLSGANTYTGTTQVNGGTLAVTGSLANTAVTIAGGSALVNGSVAGAVTIAGGGTLGGSGNNSTTGIIAGALSNTSGGGTINLAGGSNTYLVANGLTLGNSGSYGAGNFTTLVYSFGYSSAIGVEALVVGTAGNANGALSVNSGGAFISVSGSGPSGTYTLATFGSASTNWMSYVSLSSTQAGVTSLTSGFNTLTLQESSTSLLLQYASAPIPVAYFKGGVSTVWNDARLAPTTSNWSSDAAGANDAVNVPGPATDVFFNASNQTGVVSTTLGANTSINSLSVTGSGTNTIAADGHSLTLIGAATSYVSLGNALNVGSGANAFTVNVPLVMGGGANQTWTNGSANLFTVNGGITGTASTGNTQTLTLTNTGAGATTISGVIGNGIAGGAVALVINDNGSGVTLAGVNTYSGTTTISAGTLQIGSAGQLGAGTYAANISNNGALAFNSSAAQTLSGVISGNGTLNVNSTNTLTLTNTNNYSGGANVYQGTLAISALGALGSGTVNLNGGTLTINYITSSPTLANSINVPVGDSANLNLAGSGGSANNITLATGTITVNGSLLFTRNTGNYGTTTYSSAFAGSGTIVIGSTNGGAPIVVAPNYLGRASFTGSFTNFTGSFHVLAQGHFAYPTTLVAANGNNLTIDAGGYISISTAAAASNATTPIGGLFGAGTVATQNNNADVGTLSLGNNGQSGNFSGTINQAALLPAALSTNPVINIAKTGVGTQILSGADYYTGSTTITGGALNIQNNSALGAGSGNATSGVTVSSGAALQMQGGISTTTAVALKLNGTGVAASPNGALENVSGNNAYTGQITLASNSTIGVDAGTLTLNYSGGSGITGAYNLSFTGAGNGVIATNIDPTVSNWTLNGAGTWTLLGTSSVTGTTTVNDGVLTYSGTGVSNGAASLAVARRAAPQWSTSAAQQPQCRSAPSSTAADRGLVRSA